MYDWLIETFGEQNGMYIAYGGGALVVLIVLWVLWFWTRRVSGGIFVHGGRSRQPRLAVVDAAAVDSHRRIVLVRRDDVEHLVMIGGHNDFVIERGIGKAEPDSTTAAPVPAKKEKPAKAAAVETKPARAPEPKPLPETATEPPARSAPDMKPVPVPTPAAEIAREERDPVVAPEPPQRDLPGAYAEMESEAADEKPAEKQDQGTARSRVASLFAGAAPQTGDAPSEASREAPAETPAGEQPREPAFDIHPERPEPEPVSVEDTPQTQTASAKREPSFDSDTQTLEAEDEKAKDDDQSLPPDATLEDEMQKLLAELTRRR